MEIEIRHGPAFAVARATLEPGEQIQAESGAMMATSAGVDIKASTQGGVMKGLKRSFLGGESLFISTFTAPAQGGWIDLAHFLTGDIVVSGVLADQPLNITKGCWLANSAGVTLDTKWGGFKNLVGSEGGFLVRATGHGTVVLACYGALDTLSLAEGEQVTIDTGHVVAYSGSIQFALRKASAGIANMLKSGEGLVFDFTGPGWVMTQSRNPSALEAWVRALMPGETGGVSKGIGSFLGS